MSNQNQGCSFFLYINIWISDKNVLYLQKIISLIYHTNDKDYIQNNIGDW